MKRTFSYVAAIVTAVLSLAGCGEKATGPLDKTLVKAGAGTEYLYKVTSYTNGGSTWDETFHVTGTGATRAGEAGLMMLSPSRQPYDTIYARYEPNEDLTLFVSVDTNSNGGWDTLRPMTYPFGSHVSKQDRIDTVVQPGGDYSTTVDSLLYLGEETLTVQAGTFIVSKGMFTIDVRNYNPSGELTLRRRQRSTYYFAPSVGYMAKWTFGFDRFNAEGALLKQDDWSNVELVSYQLR